MPAAIFFILRPGILVKEEIAYNPKLANSIVKLGIKSSD